METGLVSKDSVEQLRRWGLLNNEAEVHNFTNPEDLVGRIRQVLESPDVVEMRDTDLDVIRRYLTTREKAKLHVPSPDDKDKTVPLPVEFCKTRMGEYVIPWTSESIKDMLLDEKTYLKPVGKARVRFQDVRELFYDDHKAFVVCTPVPVEK
jgi:hypothetical protein